MDLVSTQSIIGGAVAVVGVVGTIVGVLWKFMDGNVSHWKSLYEAKEKELEYEKQHPQERAMKLIASVKKHTKALKEAQDKQKVVIQKLKQDIQTLKTQESAEKRANTIASISSTTSDIEHANTELSEILSKDSND